MNSLCCLSHKCYDNIFENMVFTQTISSGLMIFSLLFKLLLDCELLLLQEIRKLINLESANFKLDPELSPLNDHTLIPCRTIKNFFFILLRDLTSLKKVKTPKWIEKKSTRMREKKKEEKMGMSTITQRSNHQRKEKKASQNQSLRLKSLPLRRKRFVSLLITILYCCKINHYY